MAIAALLTGNTRPVIIVTPQMSLVKQAYQDFIDLIQQLPEPIISAAQILKVDSDQSSVNSQLLMKNSTLKAKCFAIIICQDSYEKILSSDEPGAAPFKNPCMLLVDEFHLSAPLIAKLKSREDFEKNALIAGLSATPPKEFIKDNGFLISYSREQAMLDRQLAPFVLGQFSCDYGRPNVLSIIHDMPRLLNNEQLPTGQPLRMQKGIIYVPCNDKENDYSSELKKVLTSASIACFEINVGEPDHKKNLTAYKQCNSETKIIICKNMAKVGFSDNEINWVIYLQNGGAEDFCQAVGRTMRLWSDNPNKIAYAIAFNNVDRSLVFSTGKMRDIEIEYLAPLEQETPNPKRRCPYPDSGASKPVVQVNFLQTITPPPST